MSNKNLAHDDQRHAVYLLYFDDGTDIAAQIAADLRNIGYDVWQNSSAVVSVATPDNTHSYAMAHSAVILLVGTPPEDFLSSPVENSTLAQIPEDVYLAHVIVRPDTHISDLDTFDLTYWRNPTVYQRISGLLSEKIRNIVNDVQLDVPDRETQFINQFSARMERLRYPIFTTVETTSGIMHRWPRRQVFISELTGGPSFTLHEVREYHRSFVITGIPGSGKSTLLLNTARDVLRAYQARRQEFPFPLPLSLAYWNNDEAFDSFLSRNWPLDETFNELLSNGRILLLVDDFETISEQQTDELANWLADHPETQCIIATYPVFGAERLEFPVFGIVGFDQPGIQQHIAKLNTQGLNNGISKHLEQLSLHGGEAGKIAHTPLLVQLLVFLESNHCLEDIQNIGQVLAQYLQIALCEDIASLHVHGHAHALAILAANLLDHHNALALDRVSLGNIDEATINHGLRYGVLVAENDTIGFSHILIRDALAALYLLHYGLYTRLVYPTFLSPGKRVSRPWDRPLIFAAMVTRSNDSILREIADVDPLLAAIAVDQGVQANDGTQQAILRALLKLFDRHTNLDRDQIFKSLEWLSNVEAINQLVDTLYEEKANLTDEGSTMSLKSLGNNTVRLLIEIMRGDRWQRRRKAAWALGNIQEPSAIPELVQALRDENESVRREADYALARIGQPAIPALVEGLNESDPDMRAAIIKILGRIGDPSTVPHITACLNDTEWPRTEEVRVCDLAAIALEHISTEDAHAAVDSWKGTSKSAAKTSNWKARVKSSQPVNGRQQLPLEIVLERTGDADWSIRRDAARELRYHDPELALPHLLKLLADEDAQVRWAAVNSLAQFSGDVVIQGLTTALHDEDYRIVDSAAHSLAQLGETAIPDLIAALAEKNPNVRAAAAEALGVIGNDTAIPHLADALADTTRPAWEQHRVCDIAATALERIGTEQALFTLQQWRKEQKAFVTQFNRVNDPESLLQLDEINGSQDDISQQRSAIIRFLDALQESDWHSQQQAARSLREYAATLQGQEDHRAVVRLAEAINDKAAIVRWTAAEAMAWLDAEDVLPSLMQALDDNSWTVRTAAVRALAAQGDTAAVPELIKKLQDDHPLVREAAAETLGRIADTRARDSLLNALTDNDEFVRRAAVEALGNMGNSTASAVSEMLNDSSLTVRFAAIENLGKNKAAAFVDALIPLLNDTTKPDWDDRRICDLAAAALQNIDTQQAARALDNWHQNGN